MSTIDKPSKNQGAAQEIQDPTQEIHEQQELTLHETVDTGNNPITTDELVQMTSAESEETSAGLSNKIKGAIAVAGIVAVSAASYFLGKSEAPQPITNADPTEELAGFTPEEEEQAVAVSSEPTAVQDEVSVDEQELPADETNENTNVTEEAFESPYDLRVINDNEIPQIAGDTLQASDLTVLFADEPFDAETLHETFIENWELASNYPWDPSESDLILTRLFGTDASLTPVLRSTLIERNQEILDRRGDNEVSSFNYYDSRFVSAEDLGLVGDRLEIRYHDYEVGHGFSAAYEGVFTWLTAVDPITGRDILVNSGGYDAVISNPHEYNQ